MPKARSKNKCLQMARLIWQAAKQARVVFEPNQITSHSMPKLSVQSAARSPSGTAGRRRTRGRATGNSPLASSLRTNPQRANPKFQNHHLNPAELAINTKQGQPNHLSHRHTPITRPPTPGQSHPSLLPSSNRGKRRNSE